MNPQSRSLRATKTIAAIALILAAASVALGSWLFVRSQNSRGDLCRNQHSMIELQRLFLEEHEALRVDMVQVGVPNKHDPHLLERIAVLIERADCRPHEQQ